MYIYIYAGVCKFCEFNTECTHKQRLRYMGMWMIIDCCKRIKAKCCHMKNPPPPSKKKLLGLLKKYPVLFSGK